MKALMRISAFMLLLSLTAIFNTSLATNFSSMSPIEPAGEPLGEIFLLGTTWYDHQHNCTVGRTIYMDKWENMTFCWTNGLEAEALNRHIYYNVYRRYYGLSWPDIGFQVDVGYRAGYSTCSSFSSGNEVVAFHTKQSESDPWQIAVAYGFLEGFDLQITEIENPAWGEVIWPKLTVCNQNFIHIVAFENNDAMRGRIAYTRSEDRGCLFCDWLVIDTLLTVSPDIAASPASNKVGIAYTKETFSVPPDPPWWLGWFLPLTSDVYLVESEDGVSWDFSARRNITDVILADTGRYPDTTWANGDTLRGYCDVSLLYDRDDQAHLPFTTRGFWQDADRAVLPDSFFYVDVSRDASMIWHWSEEHDTLTRVADGWYDVGRSDDDVNQHRGSGGWRSAVDRPCLAQDPETGYLYCIYVRCARGDTSSGESPSHGWANGEIYCSVSTDGGLNWSEGTNLTNTPSPNCTPGNCFDEDYPSQTLVVNDTLHIIYVEDKDAGGVVMTAPQEGIWTENPVIYQKVPADLVPPGPPYVPNYYFHVGPVGATKVEEPPRISGFVPKDFRLRQNYPNPFNAVTEIRYQIPESGYISLKIFNTLGQEVCTLVDGRQEDGAYLVRWDGRDTSGRQAASGLYFCRMKTSDYEKTVRMVLIR